jgi:type IV pilus assembly protein PilA
MTNPFASLRLAPLFRCAAIPFLFLVNFCVAQKTAPPQVTQGQAAPMDNYSGLLPEFSNLMEKFDRELQFPPPRSESRLLPLLPESTVLYVAFPNYGDAAHQALQIVKEECKTSPALRAWWEQGGVKGTGAHAEEFVEKFQRASQYIGDEIVIAGGTNGFAPSFVILSEVKRPGLKDVLEQMGKEAAGPGKPGIHVLDQQELGVAKDGNPQKLLVLVRPDYVIGAFDVATLRGINARLDGGRREFPATAFGRRLEQAYQGGSTIVGALDLHKILSMVPIPAAQKLVLQRSGFGDMKYLVWEHKGGADQPASQAELSFTGPRHGAASWLAPPRALDSLDFVSPKALMVSTVVLKNLGQVSDDIQSFAQASNPNALAPMEQMQQGLGFNLKDDLLANLAGELTVELDRAGLEPEWKVILQVNDSGHLQQTLTRLLASAGMHDQRSSDGVLTYHALQVPNPRKPMEVSYTFVDGYWIIGSSQKTVRDAVRIHRQGESLAKSPAFLAALPRGHSAQASALFYKDPNAMAAMSLGRLPAEMASSYSDALKGTKPSVICAYADESSIREASGSSGVDAGVVMIGAAIAIPNLLRARVAANESSAVSTLRTLVTAQTMYAVSYPARGFARDLAALGPFPNQPGVASANHASLIDSQLGKSTCMAGAWCEKSGYRFAFAPVCKNSACKEFVAVAAPVSTTTGSRNFCATSDGVIRFSLGPPLTSTISAAKCTSWAPLH